MQKEIKLKLKEIEKERDIEILFAVESGSRVWGFASENSDWDIRFVYKKPLQEYIKIGKGKDTIELMDKDLDFSGWDIHKALGLLGKCNPSLVDWLSSNIIYKNGKIRKNMLAYLKNHFSPRANGYHFLNMAKKNYDKYIQKRKQVSRKKYLYVMRSIIALDYIKRNLTVAPIVFSNLVKQAKISKGIKQEIKTLLDEKKRNSEDVIGPRIPILDKYIENSIEKFEKWLMTAPVQKTDAKLLNKMLQNELL